MVGSEHNHSHSVQTLCEPGEEDKAEPACLVWTCEDGTESKTFAVHRSGRAADFLQIMQKVSINFYQVLKRKSLWWCVKYINGETEAQRGSEASSTSYSCFFTTARTQYSLFPKLSHVFSASLSALPFLFLPHKLEMSMCLGPQHLTLWVFIQSWRSPGGCPVRSQRKEYIGHFSNSFRDPET